MDSGLGSDDEKKSRTKAQKQLQNEQKQLFSGCFIDATSLGDDGDFELRRSDERRQGALIFRSSIPQYSMLQMPSLDSGPSSEELNHNMHDEKNGIEATETATPHNSIVQIDSEVRKTPVGFYVDLGEVEVIETVPTAPVEKKNIFSMTIDFNVPKREMPSRLSTSLYGRKKSGIKTPLSLSSSRLSDRPSSSSSNNDEGPLNLDASVEICINPECKESEIKTVKEDLKKIQDEEELMIKVQNESVDNNKEASDNISRPTQQTRLNGLAMMLINREIDITVDEVIDDFGKKPWKIYFVV